MMILVQMSRTYLTADLTVQGNYNWAVMKPKDQRPKAEARRPKPIAWNPKTFKTEALRPKIKAHIYSELRLYYLYFALWALVFGIR